MQRADDLLQADPPGPVVCDNPCSGRGLRDSRPDRERRRRRGTTADQSTAGRTTAFAATAGSGERNTTARTAAGDTTAHVDGTVMPCTFTGEDTITG